MWFVGDSEFVAFCLFGPTGVILKADDPIYEGWNFNSGNYLFTTDTK